MAELELPHGWWPREYQLPLWDYLEHGGDRAVAVWHRRAGKDTVAINYAAAEGAERVGNYWHMLPTAKQGRKVLWEAINRDGRKIIDQAFPASLRAGKREDDMLIRTRTGASFQVLGSDNYDAHIGSNPVHITFSEYSVADPRAWNYLRPVLAENRGTALWIYTPRGMNHGHKLYKAAQKAGWFTQILTADDTGVFTTQQLERERRELIEENGAEVGEMLFQQEYFCSFEAAVIGSYWGAEVAKAEREKRITAVPHDPSLPVYTIWDLGMDDATAIWFVQVAGPARLFVDYHESSNQTLAYYARVLKGQAEGSEHRRDYVYAEHFWPHDGKVRDLSAPEEINGMPVSAPQRKQVMEGLGVSPIRIVAKLPRDEGIKAARAMLATCWFDAARCEDGVDALRQYHREWDDERKIFDPNPPHDWTTHAADAFRYAAIALPTIAPGGRRKRERLAINTRGIV
jgi:hypothetical protein